MRFNRYPLRHTVRIWTPRMLAAAGRAVRRELDSVALFPELARYQTIEDRKAEVEQWSASFSARMRAYNANAWRRARRELRALPPTTRAGLVRYWNAAGCPGDPTYLLDLLHRQRTTRQSPWAWLRFNHQLQLVSAGKLSRAHLNDQYL
jgi:hypothetical protein